MTLCPANGFQCRVWTARGRFMSRVDIGRLRARANREHPCERFYIGRGLIAFDADAFRAQTSPG